MYVSIDPGTRTFGLAIWDAKTWEDGLFSRPLKSCAFTVPTKIKRLIECANFINHRLEVLTNPYEIAVMLCERPRILGNALGNAAADNILDMMFVMGHIADLAHEFETVGVNEWKGNMTKEQTHKRIVKIYRQHNFRPPEFGDTHDMDAIGIGLHCQGFEL